MKTIRNKTTVFYYNVVYQYSLQSVLHGWDFNIDKWIALYLYCVIMTTRTVGKCSQSSCNSMNLKTKTPDIQLVEGRKKK